MSSVFSSLEAFSLAATLIDREELRRCIQLSESDLGRVMTPIVAPGQEGEKSVNNGIALMKLTLFFLDEFHKLYSETAPSVPDGLKSESASGSPKLNGWISDLALLFTDEGVAKWLTENHPLLECSPLEAIRNGDESKVAEIVDQLASGAYL